MIYFKKVLFPPGINQPQMERGLRKVASKCLVSLDFKSSTADIPTDKKFLGLECKKDLKFTRIRTSFERVLPKLIVSLSKSLDQDFYKVRLSMGWTIIFIFFISALLLNLLGIIFGTISFDSIIIPALFVAGYVALIFLELKITKAKVNKAVVSPMV